MIWPYLGNAQLRKAVEVAERFADGQASAAELQAAGESIEDAGNNPDARAATAGSLVAATTHAQPHEAALRMSCYELPLAGYCGDQREEAALICDLLRDVFGNPFRPVACSRSWRTDTALSLAKQMYDSRDFSAMPILADALQDAGCDSEDVLAHCRDASATHVRGCWVVDLALGKG